MGSDSCLLVSADRMKNGFARRYTGFTSFLKLNKKRKGKCRLPTRVKQPLTKQSNINNTWSMDFMSDTMAGNRKFRTFNLIDDYLRDVLAFEIDTSL